MQKIRNHLRCLILIICRFQNKQGHHREQQIERIEREGQRSRPHHASSGVSDATVSSVNNRVPGFSRARDRDGDEYTRLELKYQSHSTTIIENAVDLQSQTHSSARQTEKKIVMSFCAKVMQTNFGEIRQKQTLIRTNEWKCKLSTVRIAPNFLSSCWKFT